MLSLLSINFKTKVIQKLITGEKANSIFRGVTHFEEVFANDDESCLLTFYSRFNINEVYEAGIYYGPGSDCENQEKPLSALNYETPDALEMV